MPADYQQLSTFTKAFAHPVRLEILNMLRSGELCVCHIERAVNQRQAYISQQLMLLRESGLVQCRKQGLQVYYRLSNSKAAEVLSVLCGSLSMNEYGVIDGCTCPPCTAHLDSIVKPQSSEE